MRVLPAIKTGALLAYTALAGAVLPGATGLAWAEAVKPVSNPASHSVWRVTGKELSAKTRRDFTVAVERCWNTAALPSDAAHVTVVVGLTIGPDRKPVETSLRLVEASGGSEAAVHHAYEAARKAILLCGRRGFPLPAEKYEAWRELELVFDLSETTQ